MKNNNKQENNKTQLLKTLAIIIWSLILIIIFLILKFRLYKATIVELDGPTAYINIEDTIYRLSLISTKITTINGKEIARNDLKVGLEIWILQKQTLDGTVKVAFNPPFFENAVKVVCFQK